MCRESQSLSRSPALAPTTNQHSLPPPHLPLHPHPPPSTNHRQVEALREFILSQGASKNETWQEWDKIWTINKKIVDPTCGRHTAVLEAGAVPLTLEGAPAAAERSEVPRHKKFAGAGMKTLVKLARVLIDQADAAAVGEGEEVTLMDWGNAVVTVRGQFFLPCDLAMQSLPCWVSIGRGRNVGSTNNTTTHTNT